MVMKILNLVTALIAISLSIACFLSGNVMAGGGWLVAACGHFALFGKSLEDKK